MKKKERICVHYLQLHMFLWMFMLLHIGAEQDRLECPEITYLEVGKKGFISCSLEPFYAVSWYTKEDYDEEKSPLLYFNGNKHGRVDEYDVHPNGSFIFRNVSLNHAGIYIVTMLRDATSDLLDVEVHLGVYVTPTPTYPVVEGHIRQQHVYMDANRNGELSCSLRRVYPNISLLWTVVDPSQSKKIRFHEGVVGRKQNEDSTFDITLTSLYEVTDQSIRRVTIQCGVANEIGEVLSSKTKVDLLFSSVYPVVNGHVNQKHVYLDVDREGHLTCIKEHVDAGTTLEWKIVDTNMWQKITFQSRKIVLNNVDGMVTINQTFDYEIHDHSVDRITIECEVITPGTNDIPVATKVDLLFSNVYPVVNGHVNQKHVYLDVDREGHLTCIKENVDAGTTLQWKVVDPALHGGISFQSNPLISHNEDDTININQTFHYSVHDVALERVAIECRVIEPDTDEHPFVTKVELLLGNAPFPFPVAVIDGCYSKQNDCVLKVERSGQLTCTVKNSGYPVNLNWIVLDKELSFDLGKSVAVPQNNSDLFDTSITTPYTIIDESGSFVSVKCTAVNANNGHLLSIARASLAVNSDSSNKSLHGTVVAFILLTMILVIVFGLIVIILLCCNRRMFKQKFLMKCPNPECGVRMFGYSIPEADIGRTEQQTDAGLPESVVNMPEDTDQDESLDSPDSGNSGSASGEEGGSEASEKRHLMGDAESSESSRKQAQMSSKENIPEELPMMEYKNEHGNARHDSTIAF